MKLTSCILIIFLIILYIGQAVWIFTNCKKQQDVLAWIWCVLALLSCPIVLIIYIILINFKKEYGICDKCGNKIEIGWRYCPRCSNEFKNNIEGDLNLNKSIKLNKKIGYLPIALFVSGVILFGVFLTFGLLNIKNTLVRITIPNTDIINLNHKGEYTVFCEDNNGSTKNYDKIKKAEVILINEKTKAVVHTKETYGASNYSFGGTAGKAFLKFKIDEVGQYNFKTNIGAENKMVISMIQNFGSKIAIIVLGSLAILGVTIVSGIIIITRRLKS